MRTRLASRSAPPPWFALARSRVLLALVVLLGVGGCDGCSCWGPNDNDGCHGSSEPDTCIFFCTQPCTCADGSLCDITGACPSAPPECTSGVTCGSVCCGVDAVCWLDQCTTPGSSCASSTHCNEGQICDFSLAQPFFQSGGEGGAGGGPSDVCGEDDSLRVGTCLPAPARCVDQAAPGCLPVCAAPTDGSLGAPALKAAWGDGSASDAQDSVIATPIVVDLEPDACNGPEIVFLTAASNGAPSDGALHAVQVRAGSAVPLWTSTPDAVPPNDPAKGVAAARTAEGQALIAVCTTDQRVRLYSGSTEVWTGEPSASCSHPSIADIYDNGQPRIVTPSQVLHASTGDVLVEAFSPPVDGDVVVADVDLDFRPDIVSAGRIYRAEGGLLADSGLVGSYAAVADLDGEGVPEIVAVQSGSGQHHLFVWRRLIGETFEVVRQPLDLHAALPDPCLPGDPGADASGGPPVLADFDGDGLPDVGVATARGYVTFQGTKLLDPTVTDDQAVLWAVAAPDCQGGRRGSVAFDFDGEDGSEVVYADGAAVSIFAGADGALLFSECNPSEPTDGYPVVADVDVDGFADLVVPASSRGDATCAGEKLAGVRVFAHTGAGWARTRPVWNEHGYHITHVASDGTVQDEGPYYRDPATNRFRANSLDRSAPNLSIDFVEGCSQTLIARVQNLGLATVPAGDTEVIFAQLAPTGADLGAVGVPVALAPGASVLVEVPLPGPRDGEYYARVRPSYQQVPWRECNPDDNSITAQLTCGL